MSERRDAHRNFELSEKIGREVTPNRPVLFFHTCVKKYTGLKFVDFIFEDDLFYSSFDGFAKEGCVFAFTLNEIFRN